MELMSAAGWTTRLFTQHLGEDKNQDRAEQAASKEQIQQGPADRGEGEKCGGNNHGMSI
jgi:hypothetical protein